MEIKKYNQAMQFLLKPKYLTDDFIVQAASDEQLGPTDDVIPQEQKPKTFYGKDSVMPSFDGMEDPKALEDYRQIELADGGVVEREGFKDGPDQYDIAQNKQAERMKKIKPLIEKGYSKTEIQNMLGISKTTMSRYKERENLNFVDKSRLPDLKKTERMNKLQTILLNNPGIDGTKLRALYNDDFFLSTLDSVRKSYAEPRAGYTSNPKIEGQVFKLSNKLLRPGNNFKEQLLDLGVDLKKLNPKQLKKIEDAQKMADRTRETLQQGNFKATELEHSFPKTLIHRIKKQKNIDNNKIIDLVITGERTTPELNQFKSQYDTAQAKLVDDFKANKIDLKTYNKKINEIRNTVRKATGGYEIGFLKFNEKGIATPVLQSSNILKGSTLGGAETTQKASVFKNIKYHNNLIKYYKKNVGEKPEMFRTLEKYNLTQGIIDPEKIPTYPELEKEWNNITKNSKNIVRGYPDQDSFNKYSKKNPNNSIVQSVYKTSRKTPLKTNLLETEMTKKKLGRAIKLNPSEQKILNQSLTSGLDPYEFARQYPKQAKDVKNIILKVGRVARALEIPLELAVEGVLMGTAIAGGDTPLEAWRDTLVGYLDPTAYRDGMYRGPKISGDDLKNLKLDISQSARTNIELEKSDETLQSLKDELESGLSMLNLEGVDEATTSEDYNSLRERIRNEQYRNDKLREGTSEASKLELANAKTEFESGRSANSFSTRVAKFASDLENMTDASGLNYDLRKGKNEDREVKKRNFDTVEDQANFFVNNIPEIKEMYEATKKKYGVGLSPANFYTALREQNPAFNKLTIKTMMSPEYADEGIKGTQDSFSKGAVDAQPKIINELNDTFATGGRVGSSIDDIMSNYATGGRVGLKKGSGYFSNLIKENIPPEYRLYAKSILPGGKKGDVDESYFKEDFKKDLRQQALTKFKETGKLKGSIGELDTHYRSGAKKYGQGEKYPINELIGLPSTYATLGSYNYEIDPQTLEVKIKDTYDWNPAYGKDSFSGKTGWIGNKKGKDVDTSMLKDYVMQSFETGEIDKGDALELLGNYLGPKASRGEGINVDIDIPVQDIPMGEGETFATGGRVGLGKGGKPKNPSRRTFLKGAGALGLAITAFGTGALKLAKALKTKAALKVLAEPAVGQPAWFAPLVDKILTKGIKLKGEKFNTYVLKEDGKTLKLTEKGGFTTQNKPNDTLNQGYIGRGADGDISIEVKGGGAYDDPFDITYTHPSKKVLGDEYHKPTFEVLESRPYRFGPDADEVELSEEIFKGSDLLELPKGGSGILSDMEGLEKIATGKIKNTKLANTRMKVRDELNQPDNYRSRYNPGEEDRLTRSTGPDGGEYYENLDGEDYYSVKMEKIRNSEKNDLDPDIDYDYD